MENLFGLVSIFVLFRITIVFSGSCEFWAVGFGPLAAEGCHTEITFTVDPAFVNSFELECASIDEMIYISSRGLYTCDATNKQETPFTLGVHCSDNSNDCSLIEMTVDAYDDPNCENDQSRHLVYILTNGPFDDNQCYSGFKYSYNELSGLTIDIWNNNDCTGTQINQNIYVPGCTSSGSSSRFVTFMDINDNTNAPTEEPTDNPITGSNIPDDDDI